MTTSKRAQRRKPETDQDGPEATTQRYSGGQSVHREMEFEGHEEKYRAVIEGATPKMNWSAKGGTRSSLQYRGEGVTHSPAAPRCLRTARYGRTMRDLRRTGRVSGWHWSKRTYKRKRNGERRSVSSRTASWYLKHSQKLCYRGIGGGSGPETGAGEGGWEATGNQMSKGGEEDQFHE
jgi:hypothetical protein